MSRPEGGYFHNSVRLVSNTEALTITRLRRFNVPKEVWDLRCKVGTAVHEVTAMLDCNGLSLDVCGADKWILDRFCVHPDVEPMVRAWEKFKEEQEFVPRLVEHSLCPVRTGITSFATTLDRAGLMRGRPTIAEIKTPRKTEPFWGVQIAGQELALLSSQGPPRERPYRYARIAVQLRSNGTYKIIRFDDPLDREVFLWALGLAVWQVNCYGWNGM